MKNKGFTLTELLGVIVILIVIFTLTFPVVNKLISQGKDTVYQTQINKILTATSDFSLQHVKYLPDYKEKSYVTLGELKHEGIISADLKDPNAGEYFKDDVVISIENVGTNYKNSNKNSFLKGSYLYTVEIGRNTDKSLLPVISMNPIKADSNGNYFLLLNLNQEYTDIAVTASSKKGVDLTNKIKKYILLNDKIVGAIDSSKPSIYKINYSVIDEDGYASASTLNIIVDDKIAPKIDFPESTKINVGINKYDLLKGVTCSDNSGYCDIKYTGEISFGVIGKYVITYTATDPSGNKTTVKRVISVTNED